MAKSDIGGVWRTVGGRRIFIKEGQDLASAMKESGKFKSTKKEKTLADVYSYTDKQKEEGKNPLFNNATSKDNPVLASAEEQLIDFASISHHLDNLDNIELEYSPKGNIHITENGKDLVTVGRDQFTPTQLAELKKAGYFKSKKTNNVEVSSQEKVLEDFKNSDSSKENFEKALNKISEMEYNNEINPDEYKDYISKIQKEYVEKNRKANEPIEKKLEKQNRYTESESIKEVKDKYMPERTKAVSQYQNGEIDRNELMKRFDGNEQRMKETFEKMGYTAPTKENIDKANTNARMNANIRNAYQEYKKKHPGSKINFSKFKDNYKS